MGAARGKDFAVTGFWAFNSTSDNGLLTSLGAKREGILALPAGTPGSREGRFPTFTNDREEPVRSRNPTALENTLTPWHLHAASPFSPHSTGSGHPYSLI